MGKDKDKQRLKKGVQPSSSAKTAELLEKSAGLNPFLAASGQAFGFGSPIYGPGATATVLTSLLIDDDLPPEVKMVFKRLQKKDAITKIKALGELAQILGAPTPPSKEEDTDDREPSLERLKMSPEEMEQLSKTLLPHWIKMYGKLVTDDNRKVREQAQLTLGQICKNVGRNLAPYLKQLMPSWYLAQHDLYSPVASASKKAFHTVFPAEKQVEVIKFCKDDICKGIIDNLEQLLRGSEVPKQTKHKENKHKGKKKGQEVSSEEGAGDERPVDMSESNPNQGVVVPPITTGGDGETYALRITCASLSALKTLIDQSFVHEDSLQQIFGEHGCFWSTSGAVTEEILVRKTMYDTLASLSSHVKKIAEPEVGDRAEILSTSKCIKFIRTALSSNQKETLPSVWNAFLILTVNGILSDIQLARKQLLVCCKNGFYGNASQIGPSVLPLLVKLWEGLGQDEIAKKEFSIEIINATVSGYGNERSLYERAAIGRTLGEIVAFLCKQKTADMEPVYQFVFSNLTDLTPDFARIFGSFVLEQSYYDELLKFAFSKSSRDVYNCREFGRFICNICTATLSSSSASKTQGRTPVVGFKRRVRFQQDSAEEQEGKSRLSFPSLPEQKQQFVQQVVKLCTETKAYKPLTVLSRSFSDESIWGGIDILEIDIPSDEDKLTTLQVYLELVNVHPETPSLLAKVSDQLELFSQDSQDFKLFLKEVGDYLHLQPIRKWVRMQHFTAQIEEMLRSAILDESEIHAILKFVFRDIFPQEFISSAIAIILDRIGTDASFFEDLSYILASSSFNKTDLSSIYKYYWDQYFLRTTSSASPGSHADSEKANDLELIESVCFRNLDKLDPSVIAQLMDKHLESFTKLQQIEALIEINKKLGFSPEMLQPLPQLKVKSDLLAFLGFFCEFDITSDTVDNVQKFGNIHRSLFSKTLFKAKIVLHQQDQSTAADLIVPLLNTLSCQAICKVWEEVEKSAYFEKLNRELSAELDVVSSRLTEKTYEDKVAWKTLWEQVVEMESTGDPLWQCRLPLRILVEYCNKADIPNPTMTNKTGTGTGSPNDFLPQLSQVLEDLSKNEFKPKDVIPWISEQRVKQPELFEFDYLFKQVKNKPLINKLLIITKKLMQFVKQEDGDLAEEYLSLGACWVAAWLKQAKYPNLSSKAHLLWMSNLSKAVRVISDKARNLNQLFPKFVQEYVEFHASQLYPVIYAWYIQLNEEVPQQTFWTQQTLFYVSNALVTCPSATLSYIEPDGGKLCDIFGKILGDVAVSLPSRITAYRILKKIGYDRTGEEELPIVPPTIGTVIKYLLKRLNEDGERQNEDVLMSYLLTWDALLKIQQGSNEFATYVRDQEDLLTPFLNILFFSERIALENASAKHFGQDFDLEPCSSVHLLRLACTLVYRVLRNLPYTVRWWWNNQVPKQRDRVFVERLITKFLSSRLAAEELGSVKLREGVDSNVTIQCHAGSNELIAHYKIEDTSVTLTVSLPLNHPLGPVTVKISDKKLHGRINQLLNTRSHSLAAGLKLWKENLDGLYKDVDECAICFFILQGPTKQIPKLACRTCRKKFHAACLYKWFSTSNKSECPLCRNLF